MLISPNGSSGLVSPSLLEGSVGSIIWTIVAFILAIVGAFVVYFLFVKPESKTDNKFLAWLKEFLDFQTMLIEPILKISYIFTALFITLSSFAIIGTSFLGFLATLIVGNLLARVGYEAGMLIIGIWKNTTEINKRTR